MTTPKPDLGRLKIDRSRAGPPNRSPLRFPVILAGFALGFVAVTFLWLRRGAAIEVTTARVEITGQGAGWPEVVMKIPIIYNIRSLRQRSSVEG